MKNIIIGTAGHIDHGKTTLIKALTGNDTDTLLEEKKRGISINLGFTYFDLKNGKRAGIVDVPGHEKFIKNMLAGASSVDMVLLVVSSEEGVMPQTIEHIDILSFLNVKNGIIVLTKCDKVEKDLLDMVKDDVRDNVKGSFLQNSKIIEVDSMSKRGFEELINEIELLSENIESKDITLPQRLNIDRSFSVKGFGTVVTGTLLEGSIKIDDELYIYPKNEKVRIRSIQVHGENCESAYAGQRTAINISNVSFDDINRGDILAKKDSIEESMMLDVKLSLVNHTKKNLKHWDRLKLYHGTKEILCRVVPLDKDSLNAGESGFCQLRLEESIVCKKQDPFVVRTYSPVETIGGGIIIENKPKKHKINDENVINSLKNKEKGELSFIIEDFLKKNNEKFVLLKDIISYTSESEENILFEIDILIGRKKIIKLNSTYIYVDKLEIVIEKIKDLLSTYHKQNRLKNGMLKEEIKSKLNMNLKDLDVLLDFLDDIVKTEGNIVSLVDFYIKLNNKQLEMEKIILMKLKSSGVKDLLTIKELSSDKYYEEMIYYMIGKNIVKLDDNYLLDLETYENLKNQIVNYLKGNKEIAIGEYRDLIGAGRKNALVLLDSFDKDKITKRNETGRVLY
ncbi:MAG: selenocysteine-specific translation elongation factor [Peptostreptococcaceae bacterium]